MHDEDGLARQFEAVRPRLISIAYAIVGQVAEAEDVVQDTWIRLAATAAVEDVRDVGAWATIAVPRRALDVLRSARVRRETYVGPWLPEPRISAPLVGSAAAPVDPANQVSLDESVEFALIVALESLTPAERTAWVLHDLFGMPFARVADIVGRTPAAVRQLAARARQHVAAQAPRVEVRNAEGERIVTAFLSAARGGDLDALVVLLDPKVVLTSDGGGEVTAARRPISGASDVARFVGAIAEKGQSDDMRMLFAQAGATPAFVVAVGAEATVVGALTLAGGLIRRVDLVLAPSKLTHVSLDRLREV